MIERADIEADFDFKAHPHMLRHARGMCRLTKGTYAGDPNLSRTQEYQHTLRYTELSPTRFKDFWR
jgi:site-specific recombinase XerD